MTTPEGTTPEGFGDRLAEQLSAIDIADAAVFERGIPPEAFALLRRHDPVHHLLDPPLPLRRFARDDQIGRRREAHLPATVRGQQAEGDREMGLAGIGRAKNRSDVAAGNDQGLGQGK